MSSATDIYHIVKQDRKFLAEIDSLLKKLDDGHDKNLVMVMDMSGKIESLTRAWGKYQKIHKKALEYVRDYAEIMEEDKGFVVKDGDDDPEETQEEDGDYVPEEEESEEKGAISRVIDLDEIEDDSLSPATPSDEFLYEDSDVAPFPAPDVVKTDEAPGK